jgi:PAS domain S-box-containing protein
MIRRTSVAPGREQDLTRRLAEAEATIAALLSGQIDAVVDPASRTPVLLAKAQAALRHERDRAQRYLDTPDVILLALDLDGRVTLVNRYACAVLGWDSADLVGRNWVDTCLPPGARDEARQKMQVQSSGTLSVCEAPLMTRSGEERLFEWRNTVCRDDDGRPIGTFSAGADITERHRAAELLHSAEEQMRVAMKTANVGTWDMDYASGVLRWSETLEAQYGLAPGTFGGTHEAFMAGVHPDDRAEVLDTIGKAVKTGAEFMTLHRTLWPDGTSRWVSGKGRVLLGAGGEPVRGIGVSLDVTDRHVLEAQFQQAQKMDAIGRLAGGVAHDFNNLLTAILGYCELLLADFEPGDPRRADIGEIQNAGTMAAGLTRQLLAFSRKQIIEPTLLDVNGIIADMRPMLERLIGADVAIVVNLRPDLALVKADRGQVEQIAMNLAVNARDAMPNGGTLTIETANVELDEHYSSTHFAVVPGSYVALTVSDTGTGMTPDVQERLFEPFFTTKPLGRGTGLGLATVHGIVTRGGGSVGVYSELDKGTSLRVYFPRADAVDLETDAPAPAGRLRTGGETVLVVDDSDGLRALAKRFLDRQGYAVLTASSADEACRLVEQHPDIDVLLTDVVMPGASGPELTRQLIEQRPALKVIYMSGYTEDAMVHHGVVTTGIGFLHKPFTSAALGQKIREVLDR